MAFEVKTYHTYILASKPYGVLYIGFTSDIISRMFQHVNEENEGFTKKYFIKRLVYYEMFDDPSEGIWREKCMKRWSRKWKIEIIEKHNPQWIDLFNYEEILPLPVE